MMSAALDSDLVDEDSSRKKILKQIFNNFDTNCSGTIKAKELKGLITACCYGEEPTDDDVTKALKEIDKYGNGTIHFAKFLKWIEAEEYHLQRGAGVGR